MILIFVLLGMFAVLIAYLVLALTISAIAFSRAMFALVLATKFTGVELVPNEDFLNYVAWVILIYGIIHFASTFPRIKAAIQFTSNIFISLLAISFLISVFVSFTGGYGIPFVVEIILKIICFGISFLGLIMQMQEGTYDLPTNKVVIVLERLFASIIYGLISLVLFSSLGNSWDVQTEFIIISHIIISVVAYILDLKLANRVIFTLPKTFINIMPK